MPRRYILLVTALIMFTFTSSSAADVIVMKSGDVKEGNVVSISALQVCLAVGARTESYPREKVSSVHFGIRKEQYVPRQLIQHGAESSTSTGETLNVGQWLVGRHVKVRVKSVQVATTHVVDMFADSKVGRTPDLQVHLEVKNTTERKIVRYREPNMFLSPPWSLKDDFGNLIRGVNYGLGSRVKGALTGKDDVLPGTQTAHVMVFTVPPVETKSLTLHFDSSVFDDSGSCDFAIPIESVRGFGSD